MSEYPIPEDLKTWYENLRKTPNDSFVGTCSEICMFIERIARLEAENAEYRLEDGILRKAYEDSGMTGRFTWSGWLLQVVRDLAETKSQIKRLEKQSDKWMIDFGIASAKNAELQAEIEQLNQRIEAKNNALAITVATLRLIEAAL